MKTIEHETEWREAENQTHDSTMFLAWGWGEYKRRQGWDVQRLALFRDNTHGPVALIQVQLKKLWRFGPRIILVQGAPIINSIAPNAVGDCIQALLGELKLGQFDIVIVQPYQAASDELSIGLMETGFVELRFTSSCTLNIDLSLPLAALESRLSANWRHNLRRSEKRGLAVKWIPHEPGHRAAAFSRLTAMYDFVSERKRFSKPIDIGAFAEAFIHDERIQMLEIVYQEKIIASRMGFKGGKCMLDVLAASSEESKSSYANYLAIWSLVQRAKDLGAEYFDCGGIDPRRNRGVYLFKKGLSGSLGNAGSIWVYMRKHQCQRLVAAALLLARS